MLGLLAFLAPDVWLADNMSFFLRQFLAAGLAGCLGGAAGFLVRHRLRLLYRLTWFVAVIAFLSLAGFTGARTLANTKPLGPAAPGDRPLKIVSINLEHLFLGDKVLQAFLEKEQPDVVVFQEVLWWLQERRWQRLGLPTGGAGKNGFPEYLKVGDLGGLAVYSRFPLTSEETRVISGDVPPGANVYYDGDRELLSLSVDTGDVQMGLAKMLPRAEMLIVTTPALAAQKVAVRVAHMGRNNYLRIVGVVENMSAYVTPDGESHELFGAGGGSDLAERIGAPLLGSIPIDAAVAAGGDAGKPVVLGEGPAADAYRSIVELLATEAAPPLDMEGCSARLLAAAEAALDAADAG